MSRTFSVAAGRFSGQPMFNTLERVQQLERQGKSILHFELGQPDFPTPGNIVAAGITALQNSETRYTSSLGMYDFKLAVQQVTSHSRNFTPDIDQILVTPGANAIIYYAIKCLIDPGDEVIIPDPGFPTYVAAINACNGVTVGVELREAEGFRLQAADIEQCITSKTKLIILNSPSNPTGAAMSEREIRDVYELALHHDLYLLSDEVYSRMIFNKAAIFFSPSMIDHCKDRTLILNGFSKAFSMTGWRLGVAIGPGALIQKMGLLNETIVSCVPPFVQRAGIEAMLGDQAVVKRMYAEYRERCRLLVDGLNSLPGISCRVPDGAIYVFPNITETGMSSVEFAEYALDTAGVAVLPGNCFGAHGDGYIRMCYVNNQTCIREALSRLGKVLEGKKCR
ncbi:MAG: pyridoxal phosphate-dependent aminotransferase [Kiritimatiellae bacterium]|nr:pyridoxal phosphate-dependent aminotransferase [Kiritimatiellia bacterium]